MLAGQAREDANLDQSGQAAGEVHLRSASELRGYHIKGTDDEIGHVVDFIVEDETWAVRYIVVDTRNWWFGKKVLIATQWIGRVNWKTSEVHVSMSRDALKKSPEWNGAAALNRDYEESLHSYYARRPYWASDEPTEESMPSYEAMGHRQKKSDSTTIRGAK